MITVIIPALNEANHIASVVTFARRTRTVSEVIVVDDGSIDGTPELARSVGARVITSTLLGKGASMEDGVKAASNEAVLFLDGDMTIVHADLVKQMTQPILDDTADFVKGSFSRSAGRVTTLTARPLLRVFFPELASYNQPLGGIVAARRSVLRQMRFENDYGVDIALLIDVVLAGARVLEVHVGHVDHESQPLISLQEMALQVVRALLNRARRYGRMRPNQLLDFEDLEHSVRADLDTVVQKIKGCQQLALFDMDRTLLNGRFVVELAARVDKLLRLQRFLDNGRLSQTERMQNISGLFAGVRRSVFADVARNIPLMPGAAETVIELRKAGYRVGIVSDSFDIAADIVRRRVFADFSFAHSLEFRRGRATGRVAVCPHMVDVHGCPVHSVCKVNVLHRLVAALELSADRVIAVGDGENDICMLRAAGCSFSYQPRSMRVLFAAKHNVTYLKDVCDLLHEMRASA